MTSVSIIIVNFNTKDILKNCLDNLNKVSASSQVIVVDNASTDGSSEMVSETFPKVKLISLRKNKGFSGGANEGLKQASGKYILYLGSDAFPKEKVIEGIVNYLEKNEDVGVATCRLILRDKTEDKDAHRGLPTAWTSVTHFSGLDKKFKGSKIFDRYFMGYKDFSKEQEIDLCISHFMFIRKNVFDKIGNWDEKFFVYGEDVDLCYRVKSAGYKIMYLPQFEALHYKGVSVGIRKESSDITKASEETKKKMRSETTRAMAIFYKKHYSKHYPKLLTGLVVLGVLVLSKLRQSKK